MVSKSLLGGPVSVSNCDSALIGTNVYAGLLMAEISLDPGIQQYVVRRQILFSIGSSLAMILGLYFMSYPEEHQEWARWSRNLSGLGNHIFPRGAEFPRYFPGMGVNILVFGVLFNTTAKRLLSHPYVCWLGKMSFAIYLLHAPLIRSLLTWMLFGASKIPVSPGKDKDGRDIFPGWIPLSSRWVVIVAIPVFYVMTYRIAHIWAVHVDPMCGRITNWFEEELFTAKDQKSEKPLLLA